MSYGYEDDSKRKRRYVIISISSVLLVSMVVAVTLGVSLNKNGDSKGGDGDVTASVKAVKEICAPTDYKKTCEDSLIANGKNSTDPMELIMTSFNVTMKQISDAAAKSETLIELQKDPRTKMALDQCKELMNYAIDELKSSFDELGAFEFQKIDEALINLRIWLSAAISHETTCLEGFQETQGTAGEMMKKALKTAVQLTHNGLAIVSELSNFVSQMQIPGLNSRRLLSSGGQVGEFPSWVDGRARRLLSTSDVKADIVVAQDGSGQYTTINEALEHVPKRKNTTFVVHIKAGLYKEYVQINKSMTHLMFIGDGTDKTRISGSKGYKDGITTYRTASAAIVGDYFIAKNIGFENTAGAIKHQAVALRVQSDMSIFYNCSMDGYQDTLYAHSHRQFYRDCTISGTIDFLFGDAAAFFQNCTLLVRKPLPNQMCPITAHGRQDPRESTGFVFQGCTIAGEPDYLAVKATSKAYLGRPWKAYSRTIIMNTFIPDFVQPQGWQPWSGNFGLETLFYSEVRNKGPGANLASRVTWPGIKTLTEEEVLKFSPAEFIQGDTWIPGNGVPYTGGMLGGKHSGSTAPVTSGSTDPTATGSTDPADTGSATTGSITAPTAPTIPASSGSTNSATADSTIKSATGLTGSAATDSVTTGSSVPSAAGSSDPAVVGSSGSAPAPAPSSGFSTFADTSGSVSHTIPSASPSSSATPLLASASASSPSASGSNSDSSFLSYASSFFGGSGSATTAPATSAQTGPAPAASAEAVSAPTGSASTA